MFTAKPRSVSIGAFAALDDESLVQNRCFLYHLVGGGTGTWDVPIGGMGVYEVHADGSLHRVEDAPDKLPRKITSLDELRQISD